MKKLLTLAFILLGSLYATSQEVKNYDQYKKVSYIDKIGKYDFVRGSYDVEVINNTTIKFMQLTNEKKKVSFVRFNIDMGLGTTTQDYLILKESIIIRNNAEFTSLKLLSPFGDEMTFWYNETELYLFYNLEKCKLKDELVYKRYYWGYIMKKG